MLLKVNCETQHGHILLQPFMCTSMAKTIVFKERDKELRKFLH